MYNAFYYNDRYYLLPPEFPNYDHFRNALDNGILPMKFSVIPLEEDNGILNCGTTKGICIAPYFFRDYIDTPVPLTITYPHRVYPVHAEVYTQEEYHAKLRKLVLEKCPGCLRYKPLSNRVQSLNGHFEEMSLDGVCLFRQEEKPAPRIFHNHLFSFGGFYMRFNFFCKSAEDMTAELKEHFYLRYDKPELRDHGDRKELILRGKSNELLLPFLTNAIDQYLDSITKHGYSIRLDPPYTNTSEWVETVLSPRYREALRKECKKYGVSLAVLEYDPQGAEEIQDSLKPLTDHFRLFHLSRETGKETYLLSDTPYILKALRYRSPMLQTYHTQFKVFGQNWDRAYDITFQMSYDDIQ